MKVDFHIHTHHSYDSLMKPEKIIKVAKKRGLDGVVICDHNTVKGGLEAKRANKDENFTVIVGAEIATNAGDVTGIFLTKEIVSRTFAEVVREIRAQNGMIILNHPYKAHDLSKIELSKIDFVEGYNSRLDVKDNQKAIDLAKNHNKPFIAGSDAHLYKEIGNCKTTVKDMESLMPLDHEYKRTKQLYVTLSQYVKAMKRRSFRIFVSASAVQMKYFLRKVLK